ncbi:MAG TPA: hypothetical protein VN461_03315 [Vicinamibacteria bacterium]|nr:hypothetical protein [Vicinamibacteria bacterium]
MLLFPLVSLRLLSMLAAPVDGSMLASIHKIDANTPVEIQSALALSAGPPVAAGAAVYVLGPKGFRKLRDGSNGFSCLVTRDHLDDVSPQCFDAEGSATTLKALLFVEEQRALGAQESEIQKAVDAGYKAGRFKAPTKPGIVYMLSPYNHLWDPDGGKIVDFPGHLMFYAPYATPRDVGNGPGAPFLVNPGTAQTLMVVVPRGSSQCDTHAP